MTPIATLAPVLSVTVEVFVFDVVSEVEEPRKESGEFSVVPSLAPWGRDRARTREAIARIGAIVKVYSQLVRIDGFRLIEDIEELRSLLEMMNRKALNDRGSKG